MRSAGTVPAVPIPQPVVLAMHPGRVASRSTADRWGVVVANSRCSVVTVWPVATHTHAFTPREWTSSPSAPGTQDLASVTTRSCTVNGHSGFPTRRLNRRGEECRWSLWAARLRLACPSRRNPGNPQGPFAERRLETELRPGVSHRHRESRGQHLLPSAYRHRATRRLYRQGALAPSSYTRAC